MAGEVKIVVEPQVVLRPLPADKRVEVSKKDGVYHVSSAKAAQLVVMTDMTNAESRLYLKEQLIRIGVIRALTKAGVKPGDIVLFGKVEMEWQW